MGDHRMFKALWSANAILNFSTWTENGDVIPIDNDARIRLIKFWV